jgi:hypothetical protein
VPLLPIDLQTVFAQTNQVGKEQAAQKDATPQAQAVQGAELAQKTIRSDSTVNVTPAEENEAEKVKDKSRRGAARKRGGAARGGKKQPVEEPPAVDVVRDPALGRNIDITS